MQRPTNPKQSNARHQQHSAAESWYSFYAGFSPAFVADVVDYLRLNTGLHSSDVIADPWNGSGTTTQIVSEKGLRSWGGDLNPAMVVVAKARLLGAHVRPSEVSISNGILKTARARIGASAVDADPLGIWFKRDSVATLRAIQQSIAELLDPNVGASPALPTAAQVSSFSPLGAFFYLALFKTVRTFVEPFACSNPTWLKRPAKSQAKVAPARNTVYEQFREHVSIMCASRGKSSNAPTGNRQRSVSKDVREIPLTNYSFEQSPKIEVASSTRLPLQDKTISAVVSSPPYCTRIDYAVATAPELAALGVGDAEFRSLRDSMIGTSTIVDTVLGSPACWGRTCQKFVDRVRTHPSKASSTYYLKSHLQYFDGLARSLAQIDRVLKRKASCVLVVQDSYYKELHNDLPTIVQEMGAELGWTRTERHDYPLRQVMSRMHKAARRYRRSSQATESALVFRTS